MPADATILAKNFKHGRAEPIRLIVLHSTENPCAPGVAHNVASWFAGASAPEASAHYVVGPDETVQCVLDADTAWHAPPTNAYSLGIEQTGRAAVTADEWATDAAKAMLARSVALVAELCTKHQIPPVFVDAAGLVRGDHGITTHVCVTNAFHQSPHTDPGASFPSDDYVARVADLVANAEEPPPSTEPSPGGA